MSARRPRLRRKPLRASLSVAFLAVSTWLAPAAAQETAGGSGREASKHFQRGVSLYGEADYGGALVEFKRAYAVAPNAAVLYNVGEAQYQLRDYAGALKTFERFLAEASHADGHRPDVEASLELLRARVGHLRIVTSPEGADVTVDDEPVGKTPFGSPLLVSVGHRKIVAIAAGHAPVTRFIDVGADDNVALILRLPAPAAESNPLSPESAVAAGAAPAQRGGVRLRAVGWVATGGLAVGAATFGFLALKASSDLKSARNKFPTTSATLAHDGTTTTTYAVLADSLTVAAVLVGGISLFSTLSSPSAQAAGSARRGGTKPFQAGVELGLSSARFEMSF